MYAIRSYYAAGCPLAAELQVAEHAQMGKQAGLLENITERPTVGGQPVPVVLPDPALERQPAMGGAFQSG